MPKKSAQPTTRQLQARIAELEAELAKTRKPRRRFNWHTPVVALSVLFFCIFLAVGSITFAVNRTITDTDTYMRSVGPVIKRPEVQAALVKRAEQAIFEQVNVEQIVQSALPPRAEFLAGPISDQVRSKAHATLQKAVGSERFYKVWLKTNRTVHDNTLNLIKNSNGNPNINVNQLYVFLSQQVQDTPLQAVANKKLPSKVGNITVVKVSRLPQAQRTLKLLTWVQNLSLILALGLAAVALALSRQWRKTATIMGLGAAITMAVLLISIQTGQFFVLRTVHDATYHAAAAAIWQTVLAPTVSYLSVLLFLGVLAAVVSWASSSSKLAQRLRSALQLGFARIHQLMFRDKQPAALSVLRHYQSVGYWLLIIAPVSLFLFLFRPLTIGVVAKTTIIAALLAAILAILVAVPAKTSPKSK